MPRTVPFEAAQAITRKKGLYGRYVDTKRWDEFDQVALPDAEFSFLDSNGSAVIFGKTAMVFSSRKAFTAYFSNFFKNVQSLHMFRPGEFEQVAPDEVKVIWSLEDQLIFSQGLLSAEMRGGGYYYETWKSMDGDWFLKSLVMRRTYQKLSLLAMIRFLLASYLA